MSTLTMTTPGNSGWIEFSGPDTAEARAFYTDVMGWTINEMPMQSGGSYAVISIGENGIGGFSPMPAEEGVWTVYITVEDVDAATERARNGGGTIIVEPWTMPGVGRMSVFTDPQGARIALITYESMAKEG